MLFSLALVLLCAIALSGIMLKLMENGYGREKSIPQLIMAGASVDDVYVIRLSSKFSKIWVAAELMLFVLVGATVDISYAATAGLAAVTLILVALLIRICSVFVCLIKTKLNIKERFFCAIAYLPKATVQAAIGGLPLAAGVTAGNTILTVAVLAILITAPVGAIGVDAMYKKMLR